jgi:hypothetical protein
MAFPAIAALIAGQAVTAAAVLTTVSSIGAVMSVVGVVTGSKSLMKVGGVLGLVGGVGSLINGVASGAASAVGEVAAEGAMEAASAEAMSAYGGAAAGEAAQAAGVAGMGGEVAGLAGGADWGALADEALGTLGTPEPVAALSEAAVPTGEVAAKSALENASSEAMSAYGGGQAAPLAEAPSQGLIGQNTNVLDAPKASLPKFDAALPQAGSKDYFSNFMKWVKDNKEVAKLGLEGVKGMVGSESEDAKTDYYKAETNRHRYGNEVARFNPRPLIGARA